MASTVANAFNRFKDAKTAQSDGGATITLTEATQMMNEMIIDDGKLDFREMTLATELRDHFTTLPVAPGVLSYSDNFIAQYNSLATVTGGRSDFSRAAQIDKAVPYYTDFDPALSKKVTLADLPAALHPFLLSAQSKVDVMLDTMKADAEQDPADPIGVRDAVEIYEVYASALDHTVIGYALNGWYHNPSWDTGVTAGIAPDGRFLFVEDESGF